MYSAQDEVSKLKNSIDEIIRGQKSSDPSSIHSLVQLCEEFELFTWSVSPEPIHPNYYAIFLAGLLTLRELNQAKHLWRRIPQKNGHFLPEIWAVGQALWKRDAGLAFSAIRHLEDLPLSGELRFVVSALKVSIRSYNVDLLGQAYTSVPVSVVSQALGQNINETIQLCASRGWEIKDEFVYPTKAPVDQENVTTELDQLHNLSAYILHLEQRTVLKI